MRALVVEDDRRIASDLERALSSAGFRVERIEDGETAWFRGGTESYDLIVLDLGLPRLDGLTVLKRWRAEGCESPVLILTARGAWTERVEGIDAGADSPRPSRSSTAAPSTMEMWAGASGVVSCASEISGTHSEIKAVETSGARRDI